MPTATPADVLARRSQLILSGDADGLADLFAPDAVLEFCFHGSPGTPVRIAGREAIREYSRQVMAAPMRIEVLEVTELYQTQDPAVVVAEMRAKATVTATGRSITATSIQVLRIREGRIELFRDFADPRVFEALMGDAHAGQRAGLCRVAPGFLGVGAAGRGRPLVPSWPGLGEVPAGDLLGPVGREQAGNVQVGAADRRRGDLHDRVGSVEDLRVGHVLDADLVGPHPAVGFHAPTLAQPSIRVSLSCVIGRLLDSA